jgi:hypothetical protein
LTQRWTALQPALGVVLQPEDQRKLKRRALLAVSYSAFRIELASVKIIEAFRKARYAGFLLGKHGSTVPFSHIHNELSAIPRHASSCLSKGHEQISLHCATL